MNPACQREIPVALTEADADFSAAVASAMSAARSAQSRRPGLARCLQCVRRLRQLIAENALALAEASAAARLRPAGEALTAEVLPLAESCRFLERHAQTILAAKRFGAIGRPLWLAGVRSEIHREPFGVVLIIGPGNYPLLLPGVQAIQALVTGNAVLIKPGVGGISAALALRELIVRAGFPAELIAVLPESTEAARAAIAARPDKVIFTGSVATGERILAQLAPELIPATMELSGGDAVVVRADADLDLTVKALAFGLRLNGGATCLAPKRVFVHRSVATDFEGRLAREFNSHGSQGAEKLNDFSSPTCESPSGQVLIASAATEKLRSLLDDAVASGARFLAGGVGPDGRIATPLVIAGVHANAQLLTADVFLPVLALVTVADDHEAFLRANDGPFALGVSIFTRDEAAARALAGRFQAGVVTINDLIVPTADARLPFGGTRRSGFGATRGAEGLLELTRPKVITLTRGKFRPAFAPPQPSDAELFKAYLEAAHGRGTWTRLKGMVSVMSNLLARPDKQLA
ncbi:MAG TPA: aldehyde dehydrogenase family protein [Verrucomicrobiota bacterium]|nr:aldehyde dehydrogenase family protein [Verrucomicrobiota bacterium]